MRRVNYNPFDDLIAISIMPSEFDYYIMNLCSNDMKSIHSRKMMNCLE